MVSCRGPQQSEGKPSTVTDAEADDPKGIFVVTSKEHDDEPQPHRPTQIRERLKHKAAVRATAIV